MATKGQKSKKLTFAKTRVGQKLAGVDPWPDPFRPLSPIRGKGETGERSNSNDHFSQSCTSYDIEIGYCTDQLFTIRLTNLISPDEWRAAAVPYFLLADPGAIVLQCGHVGGSNLAGAHHGWRRDAVGVAQGGSNSLQTRNDSFIHNRTRLVCHPAL